MQSRKFKSRKLSWGSGSAPQSPSHPIFTINRLRNSVAEHICMETITDMSSHMLPPLNHSLLSLCKQSIWPRFQSMHTIKNTNNIIPLYVLLINSWYVVSIIFKSAKKITFLNFGTRQWDAIVALWRRTNTAQPVPWAQKALSNNALKRPHSAGSNLGFVASVHSLTQPWEGEQNVSFTLNELWNYSESSIFTLAVSNVSCCRQFWIMKMSA